MRQNLVDRLRNPKFRSEFCKICARNAMTMLPPKPDVNKIVIIKKIKKEKTR